jgi:hypothetical protein
MQEVGESQPSCISQDEFGIIGIRAPPRALLIPSDMSGLQKDPVERIKQGFCDPLWQDNLQSDLKKEKRNDGKQNGE